MVNINIKKLNEKAQVPEFQTKGSAGFDLHSTEDVILDRNCTALVGTGLAFEIPQGFEMQIRPRSGLAMDKQLTVLNSPGTIDSDYRGEVGVILHNVGSKAQQIEVGDRIAQGVLQEIFNSNEVKFEEVDELSETERGEGGFGSTGE